MLLLSEDKSLIKALRQKKGYWARKLTSEFLNKTWTLSGLRYTYGKSMPWVQWRGGKATPSWCLPSFLPHQINVVSSILTSLLSNHFTSCRPTSWMFHLWSSWSSNVAAPVKLRVRIFNMQTLKLCFLCKMRDFLGKECHCEAFTEWWPSDPHVSHCRSLRPKCEH